MSVFENKKRLILVYGFYILWALAVFLVIRFLPQAQWMLTFVFFFFLFFSGFVLSRILKFSFEEGIGQLILWLSLGFVWIFLLSFLAILLGWTLTVLTDIYIFSLIGIFFLALFLDLISKVSPPKPFYFKEIFQVKNLSFLILSALVFLILCVLAQQGADFRGDPSYHLAIMRKAFGGEPLTAGNLSYIKNYLDPLYAFPIWHVSLAVWGKITGFNIFNIWANIIVPLTILIVLVWYWLFKKIFSNEYIAILGSLIFLIFIFNQNSGYIFTRLPIPDSLNQYLFLPLVLSLVVKFVFDKFLNYRLLFLILILGIFLAAIHALQYIYLFLILIIFAFVLLAWQFFSKEMRKPFLRIGLVVIANILLASAVIFFLEIKGSLASKTLRQHLNLPVPKSFKADSFKKLQLMAKLGYLGVPLILIFLKKHPKLIFLVAIFLAASLVFVEPLKFYFSKIFSNIFVDRYFYNFGWYFAIWAAILGFIFLILDRFLVRPKNLSVKIFLNGGLVFLAVLAVWLEKKYTLLPSFYNRIFSSNLNQWLSKYFLILMLVLIGLAIIILVFQKIFRKFDRIFILGKFQNQLLFVFLTFISVYFLSLPNHKIFKKYYKREISSQRFFKRPYNSMMTIINPKNVGGMETIDFINQKIPPKKVFLTNGGYFQLPLLVDQYLPTYHSQADKEYLELYDKNISIDSKLTIIESIKLDYILIVVAKNQNKAYFDQYPDYFIKIYDLDAVIYKINQEAIKNNSV